MAPKGKGGALGAPRSCPPPTSFSKSSGARGSQKNVLAAGAVAGAAAGGAGAAGAYVALDDESEDEGEEEEESEEAQVCWGAVFSFLPVIIEIVMEFSSAAAEAGICQYIAMAMLPIYNFFKALFGIANAPPAPPAYAPPAPPPPPHEPTMIKKIEVGVFGFAESHPVIYLLIDLALFLLAATFFLYLKDIQDYMEARRLAALAEEKGESPESPATKGYQELAEEQAALEQQGESFKQEAIMEIEAKAKPTSSAELAKELTRVVDRAEELEVRVRVHRKSQADWVNDLREELKQLHERRDELKRLLGTGDEKKEDQGGDGAAGGGGGADGAGGGAGGSGPPSPGVGGPDVKVGADGKPIKVKRKKPPPPPPGQGAGREAANAMQKVLKGPFMGMVMRTVTGVMAISLYFMDIISDVQVRLQEPLLVGLSSDRCTGLLTVPSPPDRVAQVIQLLWDSENWLWCWMSIFLLVAQFLVVWVRVIPYLENTFGKESYITLGWLWGGFPWGLLFLDGLMFLEPFGLLTILPFPAWLKQFLPAFKATRTIAEVVIESVPQSVLQVGNASHLPLPLTLPPPTSHLPPRYFLPLPSYLLLTANRCSIAGVYLRRRHPSLLGGGARGRRRVPTALYSDAGTCPSYFLLVTSYLLLPTAYCVSYLMLTVALTWQLQDSLATLPKSILISSLATLKTWVELVFGARAAGLTVLAKGLQLWHVGAGLPLDALKKGTIVDWSCPYKLDPSEVQPLLDALSKNGSLTRLDLGKSGITFIGADATGFPLVDKMSHTITALSDLKT